MWGVLSEISSKRARGRLIPASWAMAGRWRAVFDDPPKAMSTVIAFLKAQAS